MFLFLTLMITAPDADRVARWREDVAVTRTDFLAKDKSYAPEAKARAEQRLDRLSADLPNLTDQEIVAELARVAALADNPHTRAYLLRNRGWWRRYPIRIWRFADGWRVIAVRPGQEALFGGRIVCIGGRRVAEAEAAVRPLFAGPEEWAHYMASYSLTSPDALLGTGVLRGDGQALFEIEQKSGRQRLTLPSVDEPRRGVPEESWWFLSPAHDGVKGWSHVLAGRDVPEHLANPGRWYDLRQCSGNTLYLPFSRSEDQPSRPTLAQFGEEVLAAVAREPDAKLIIDLRYNTGGNLQKTFDLFRGLAASPIGQIKGRLFVIMGPSTFSAGITPAAILKEGSNAIFVGSEPGDRMQFWAEGGNVTLPNSGILMHYADRAHLYAPGARPVPEELVYLRLNAKSLKPDRPVSVTFRDYAEGRDPVADAIVPGGLSCSAR